MRQRTGPVFWISMALLSLVFLVPLVWMFLTSLKTADESRTVPLSVLPASPTTRAYELLFGDPSNPVLTWFLNSMMAAAGHAALVLVVCSMAGYALARMEFPGKKFVFGLIIGTLFLPGFIFLMPNFVLLDKIGWLDQLWALIVPGAAGAFGVFFMRQFFMGLPKEFEESARLDGAGPFRTFWAIVLPNAKPAVVTLGVLSFLSNWNDFIWPIYVLFSPEKLTLPVGLSRLQGAYNIDYPVIMAGASIAAIPVLVLFIFAQRYIIEGVANSGLKG